MRNYLLQRYVIINDALRIMNKERWIPSGFRRKFGVQIPLSRAIPGSRRDERTETWRIYGHKSTTLRPLDRSSATSEAAAQNSDAALPKSFVITGLPCACKCAAVESSFAQPTIERVLQELPVFATWRRMEQDKASPATNIER